ncbi:MAG TPA: hypothetical protein GXZ98_07385 [Firmicutes bacterium]|jgi:hypothetical protein|nr:hypothetical protein [Bacillota bacterium]
MKIKVLLAIVFFILAVTSRTDATVNGFSFPPPNRVAAALKACEEQYGTLAVEEGEIIAVTADRISFRGYQTGEKTIPPSTTAVFVNGCAGELAALRPIAPGFYFTARLYFDQQGVLRLVDGWYIGAEVEILAVETGSRFLTVQPLDQTQTYRLHLSPHLTIPSSALVPGKICFLLLNGEHQVFKILWLD